MSLGLRISVSLAVDPLLPSDIKRNDLYREVYDRESCQRAFEMSELGGISFVELSCSDPRVSVVQIVSTPPPTVLLVFMDMDTSDNFWELVKSQSDFDWGWLQVNFSTGAYYGY